MRWQVKALLILVILTPIVLALAAYSWLNAGPSLQETATSLRNAGWPATAADLEALLDLPPDIDNAALPFKAAFAEMEQLDGDLVVSGSSSLSVYPTFDALALSANVRREAVEALLTNAAELAQIKGENVIEALKADGLEMTPELQALFSSPTDNPDVFPPEAQWVMIQIAVGEAEAALAAADPAADARWPVRADFGPLPTDSALLFDVLLPHLNQSRHLARLQAQAAWLAAAEGDTAAALRHLHVNWSLAEAQAASGFTLVDSLSQMGVMNLTIDALAEVLVATDSQAWQDPDLRALLKDLLHRIGDERAADEGFQRAVAGEIVSQQQMAATFGASLARRSGHAPSAG